MPVQAVLCNIQLTTDKPFHVWLSKIPFQNLIPLFSPGKFVGNFCPEFFGVIYAALIGAFIFFKRGDAVAHILMMEMISPIIFSASSPAFFSVLLSVYTLIIGSVLDFRKCAQPVKFEFRISNFEFEKSIFKPSTLLILYSEYLSRSFEKRVSAFIPVGSSSFFFAIK